MRIIDRNAIFKDIISFTVHFSSSFKVCRAILVVVINALFVHVLLFMIFYRSIVAVQIPDHQGVNSEIGLCQVDRIEHCCDECHQTTISDKVHHHIISDPILVDLNSRQDHLDVDQVVFSLTH